MLKPKHEEMSDSTFFVLLLVFFFIILCAIYGFAIIISKTINLIF